MKTLVLTLAIVLAAGARPAHACDPTESPNCGTDPTFAGFMTAGGVMAASVPLAGLITAVGGGTHLRSKDWRRANYIFGTMGVIEAMALGVTGALVFDNRNPQAGGEFMGAAVGALAIGVTDIALGVTSAVKVGRERAPIMTVVPLASRDLGGLALTGRF